MSGFNLPPGVSILDDHINPPDIEADMIAAIKAAASDEPAFSVVASFVYLNTKTGQSVSPYGACPWRNDAEKAEYRRVSNGWTIYDRRNNTYGCGRPPMDRETAQSLADTWNNKLIADKAAKSIGWDYYDDILDALDNVNRT